MKLFKKPEITINFLKEDIEEVIMRCHIETIRLRELLVVESHKKRPDKELLNDTVGRLNYYKGKFYAYYYVLEHIGSDLVPVLKRLRGIEFVSGGEIKEHKKYFSESFGHFEV